MTKQQLETLAWVLKKMRAEALWAEPADAQALSQRNEQDPELVAKIDRVLRKLAESPDEVGACEECGEPIASKRLAVMPYATLCAECQRSRSLTDHQ